MMRRKAKIPVDQDESLHLRPMQVLNERAMQFEAELTLTRNGQAVDAKSMLELTTLAGRTGPLTLEARGPDADEAVAALSALLDQELNKG
ncbi:MAG: HPr family phosphocarrier protein [Planctomycetota bacterium]